MFVKAYIKESTIRWQVVFRLCHEKDFMKFVGKILWKINHNWKFIKTPYETEIGYGLYIGHGGPIVVNPTAKIGNNCNRSQFITIGFNEGNSANIGENVYIGSNVCIVQDVKIGNNVTIGAGNIVTKDISDNTTAVGNYAKVINYNKPGRYIGNRWEFQEE